MRRLAPIGLSLVSLVMVAACTSAEEPADPERTDDVQTPTTRVVPEDSTDAAADLPPCTVDDVEVAGAFGEAPEVTLTEPCGAPAELIVAELEPGEEPAVAEGDTALMDYQLTLASTGEIADSSYQRGEPFAVENVGQAQVIQGWNEGLVGLTTGSRNLLIIPPELAYGTSEESNHQLAGETLIFVVDVVETEPAA
ncbi:peptidylprolyl isomerase [Actinoalloteichus hoggarensis]|uniref:Peptidyl-prolyl cis-trans isomerase n=1 Tax=Actinoalloteichus hoggarensis TaxID=1470176 RepID=A0A221W2H5_9PSEU|nr:FKBP-type peptidyl-prolyl cis-trans isomerase [Actinoalloteichus hoggarensis]ASO19992.1 FK506-binding protein [Actinoalloteichus hoggarensis]MBB5919298.1 peptidylprolyl isomerase [Actinoalloteichus hoggarensis]